MYSFYLFLVWICCCPTIFAQEISCDSLYRSYDGSCNNRNNPEWGLPGSSLLATAGFSTASNLPNARFLSNTFLAEEASKPSKLFTTEERRLGLHPNRRRINVLANGFNQLIGHDMSNTRLQSCFGPSCFVFSPILDQNDPLYMTKDEIPALPVNRTLLFVPKGVLVNGTHLNDQTSFLDGSVFYGPTEAVVNTLREFQDGLLKMRTDVGDTQYGELPNSKVTGTPNQCSAFGPFGMATGDPRTETNSVLASLHTLWAREHNRLARQFKIAHPSWDDERLFQEARKWVVALFQHIAVDEFLPIQFGAEEVARNFGRYTGYNPTVNPTPSNLFAVSANRLPHDQVNLPMLVVYANGSRVELPGTEGFPDIERISCIGDVYWQVGTTNILRGNLAQYAQSFDGKHADDVRSFPAKVSTPLPYNFDVKVMDIEREREAKVPSYYHVRKALLNEDLYAMPGCSSLSDSLDTLDCFFYVTRNQTAAELLRTVYGRVDRLDFHIGMVTEDDRSSSGFPRLGAKVWLDQIAKARSGDRLWFENFEYNGLFTRREFNEIKGTTMRDIVLRNTDLDESEVDSHAFRVVS